MCLKKNNCQSHVCLPKCQCEHFIHVYSPADLFDSVGLNIDILILRKTMICYFYDNFSILFYKNNQNKRMMILSL